MRKWALLGATSGLGLEFLRLIEKSESEVLSISRRAVSRDRIRGLRADFSKTDQWEMVIQQICDFHPETLIYFAGGGPYGKFIEKKFADHQWAFRVNFEFPALLLHRLLSSGKSNLKMVFIGSSIAENQPDPGAVSYAAAKHALRGMIGSLQKEANFDLHLFSPGYMDTRMLPPNAWPRQQAGLVRPAEAVARELAQYLNFPID